MTKEKKEEYQENLKLFKNPSEPWLLKKILKMYVIFIVYAPKIGKVES